MSSEVFAKGCSNTFFPLLRNSVFSEDWNTSKMIKDTQWVYEKNSHESKQKISAMVFMPTFFLERVRSLEETTLKNGGGC